jgi:8-oxo-dGTP diphosphatase
MNRKQWQGRDADRRLTERGRRHAIALAGLFDAFGSASWRVRVPPAA